MKRRWIVVEERGNVIFIVARCLNLNEATIVHNLTPYRSWIVDDEGWAALRALKTVETDT